MYGITSTLRLQYSSTHWLLENNRFKVTSCRKVSCIDLARDEPKFGDNLIIFHETNQSFQ